ncbi:MAG: transcriptional regulator, partial [Candidatus Bathyarchaeia archaeon]
MISIFEFSYRYIIPSIKRRLVEKLVEIGVTRKEIAKKLDLSTSAISRYLSMERGTYINIAVYNDVDNAVNKLASLIKN